MILENVVAIIRICTAPIDNTVDSIVPIVDAESVEDILFGRFSVGISDIFDDEHLIYVYINEDKR